MKILLISDNFPPEQNAPANRTFAHADIWQKAGESVTVITGAPNFPQGKVFSGYSNRCFFREKFLGLDVIRVWTFIWPNRGFFLRLLDFLSFAKTASLAGLFVNFDVLITTSPQFFVNFAGFFLSFVKRRSWILEVRDLWPESAASVGLVKRRGLLKAFEWLELFFYRRANVIVVVTEGIRQSLIGRGIDPQKIIFAPNGADLDLFKQVERRERNAEALKTVVYAGTFGLAHALDFILKSIANLEKINPELASKFRWRFIGDGAERGNLLRLHRELQLKNVEIFYPVSRAELVQIYRDADWGLVNLRKSDTFLGALPSKIFELAAMGLPIFLGVEGEAKGVVSQFKAGVFFEPESQKAFYGGLEQIANCKAGDYFRLSEGGRELARFYSRDRIAKELLRDIYAKLDPGILST